MRILITGASGLLGLNLALEVSKEHVVFGTTHRHVLQTDAFRQIRIDLLNAGAVERLLEETRPDWVINCAALALVDACESNPALARQLNSEFPGKLAAYVARGGARLVHVSTDAVFDGQRGDYTEEDPPNPLSVYAQTKWEGEIAVAEAFPQAIIARTNLYGWSLTGKRSLAEWFFYNLQAGANLKGFTDVYFCPLLANDIAHLLLAMLQKGLQGVYHVVSSECISKYDFGVALARRFGFDERLIEPSTVDRAGLAAARSRLLTLRSEKLTRDLGFSPQGIQPGLDRFYHLQLQGYPDKLRKLLKEEG